MSARVRALASLASLTPSPPPLLALWGAPRACLFATIGVAIRVCLIDCINAVVYHPTRLQVGSATSALHTFVDFKANALEQYVSLYWSPCVNVHRLRCKAGSNACSRLYHLQVVSNKANVRN